MEEYVMLLNAGRTKRGGAAQVVARRGCRRRKRRAAGPLFRGARTGPILFNICRRRPRAVAALAGRARGVDFLGPAPLGAAARARDLAPAAAHEGDGGDERALDPRQVFAGLAG